MTGDEFDEMFARQAGVTTATLRLWGRYPHPCDCDYPGCPGWNMGHQWEDAIVLDAIFNAKVNARGL